jgi:hypothetical protein
MSQLAATGALDTSSTNVPVAFTEVSTVVPTDVPEKPDETLLTGILCPEEPDTLLAPPNHLPSKPKTHSGQQKCASELEPDSRK